MTDPRPRFAVYLRISRDPDGTSTAPERQLKDCRAFAELREWDIVQVFREADVSAYRQGVRRPAYDELVAGIDAGAFDGVLVWRLDRLVRRTVEFADFWRLADARGVRLASATQPVDTGDPVGMLIVHILVAFAEMESATMSARIKAKEREMADRGQHKAAGWRAKRTYGHEAGWGEVNEPEAAVIREVAHRVLVGESLTSLTRELNDRGTPAPGGGRWSRRGLVTLLRSARLFGWRDYEGELTAQGDWPAIISEADGRALRDLFDRPAEADNRRRHLLSGILRCGRCGHPMKAGRAGGGDRRYICPPKGDTETCCGRVVILADPTDEAIEAMVTAQLESPGMARTLAARRRGEGEGDEAELLAELAELRRVTDEAAADRASGDLSRAAYLAMQKATDRRTDVVTRRLGDLRRAEPLDVLGTGAADALAARYRGLPLERRRRVIDALLASVRVLAVDDPDYLAALHETLTDEADAFRASAAELREQARGTETPDKAGDLRRAAEKADQDARRRVRQVRNGGNAASRWRVERLALEWRA